MYDNIAIERLYTYWKDIQDEKDSLTLDKTLSTILNMDEDTMVAEFQSHDKIRQTELQKILEDVGKGFYDYWDCRNQKSCKECPAHRYSKNFNTIDLCDRAVRLDLIKRAIHCQNTDFKEQYKQDAYEYWYKINRGLDDFFLVDAIYAVLHLDPNTLIESFSKRYKK